MQGRFSGDSLCKYCALYKRRTSVKAFHRKPFRNREQHVARKILEAQLFSRMELGDSEIVGGSVTTLECMCSEWRASTWCATKCCTDTRSAAP